MADEEEWVASKDAWDRKREIDRDGVRSRLLNVAKALDERPDDESKRTKAADDAVELIGILRHGNARRATGIWGMVGRSLCAVMWPPAAARGVRDRRTVRVRERRRMMTGTTFGKRLGKAADELAGLVAGSKNLDDNGRRRLYARLSPDLPYSPDDLNAIREKNDETVFEDGCEDRPMEWRRIIPRLQTSVCDRVIPFDRVTCGIVWGVAVACFVMALAFLPWGRLKDAAPVASMLLMCVSIVATAGGMRVRLMNDPSPRAMSVCRTVKTACSALFAFDSMFLLAGFNNVDAFASIACGILYVVMVLVTVSTEYMINVAEE